MTMITDPLYGTFDITEPVLLALLEAPTVQRLKGVLQHGITGLIGVTKMTSRYDHSVGAMLIVRRMGASVEEQAAALLHDISHTAFSHVIDYVVGSHQDQGYHEKEKIPFVRRSELPALLADHGFDWQRVIHEEYFALLEQPLPVLCADRLDYFLRDAVDLGITTMADSHHAINHLIVQDGRIMVDDLDVGRWLAYHFIETDNASWSDFREVGLYELAARAIRMGLEKGVITEDDFWRTDAVVWQKLHDGADDELRAALALVIPETRFARDADHPDFAVGTKIRAIDPEIVLNGSVKRLSELDAAFAAHRKGYLERKSGVWPFKVIA